MFATRKNFLIIYNSIGKKLLTGVTGIGLTLFVVFHASGNLLLFKSAAAYNQFADWLHAWSWLLYGAETILLLIAIVHGAIALAIQVNKYQARTIDYSTYRSIGKPSLQSFSSRSMIYTGIGVLIFLGFHLADFKYGTYYTTTINGVQMRDLARLVVEKFRSPIYTFGYVSAIIVLGFHLRHGIWSSLQSLGLMNAAVKNTVYFMALIIAILISVGFIVLPLSIYFAWY